MWRNRLNPKGGVIPYPLPCVGRRFAICIAMKTATSISVPKFVIRFFADENGQDLVEYALVLALIALGATASMSALATSFSQAFTNVGSHVATYTT